MKFVIELKNPFTVVVALDTAAAKAADSAQ